MCKSGVLSFCGDGNGASKDAGEVLLIVVGETKPESSSKNTVGLAKPKIS